MKRALLFAGLLLIAVPALARIPPSNPLGPSGEQGRSFSLKNMSHQVVVFAQAHMTDGKVEALTYSPIEPGQARKIIVPRKACLAEVMVQLNDGHSLRLANLDDCRSNQLVVGDRKIRVQSVQMPRLRNGKLPPLKD